jgi:hypothetical protein
VDDSSGGAADSSGGAEDSADGGDSAGVAAEGSVGVGVSPLGVCRIVRSGFSRGIESTAVTHQLADELA